MKILHVDDESGTLEVVKIILEKAGYEVVSVNCGKGAFKEIKLDGFDLILLDIMLPDMSGWEIFTRICKIKPKYKVIFLSVLDLTEDRLDQMEKAGVKDYIKKPFDRDDLIKRVKKALE